MNSKNFAKSVSFIVLSLFFATSLWADDIVNFAHLEHLTVDLTITGQKTQGIVIYADGPDFKLVNAPGEGFACVDDVARAAVLYIDANKLDKARPLLNFVLQLQGENGLFYNFVYKDGTINRFGKTSRLCDDFWTSRGLWALGKGAEAFRHVEPVFAKACQQGAEKTLRALGLRMKKRSKLVQRYGRTFPTFFLLRGTDCWSEALLGAVALHRAFPSSESEWFIKTLANALADCRAGSKNCPPFGGFFVWAGKPFTWHGWGSRQAYSLIEAGTALSEPAWIDAAQAEVDGLHEHFFKYGLLATMDVVPEAYPQIAYTLSPLIQSAAALYRLRGRRRHREIALAFGAWFLGANSSGEALYDPESGRCYDGIDDGRINKNSGAESTIEALIALWALRDLGPIEPPKRKCLPRIVIAKPESGRQKTNKVIIPRSGSYHCVVCRNKKQNGAVSLILDGKAHNLESTASAGVFHCGNTKFLAGEHKFQIQGKGDISYIMFFYAN